MGDRMRSITMVEPYEPYVLFVPGGMPGVMQCERQPLLGSSCRRRNKGQEHSACLPPDTVKPGRVITMSCDTVASLT